MAYTISRQSTTGLFIVQQDGIILSRAELAIDAINIAINNQLLPTTEAGPLLEQANQIVLKEKAEIEQSARESAATTPEQTDQQNNTYVATGGADDDKTGSTGNPAAQAAPASDPIKNTDLSNDINTANNGSNPANTSSPSNAATNTTTQRNVGSDPKPGTRLTNPLSNFTSYTYQLSLYMITPDAYSAYVASGRKNINAYLTDRNNLKVGAGGAFLILQSGGVNVLKDARPPGFDYDYYIDDLRITTKTNAKETQTSSNVSKLSFNIIEPYGFSLISKLVEAHNVLKKVCKIPGYEKTKDATKQFFILGIRFQGYDKKGDLANSSIYFSDDTANTSSDKSGVYERFYDIAISKFTFKLAGGATTYNVNAKVIPNFIAMQTLRGTVDNSVTIVADTVENALGPGVPTSQGLNSLFDSLNDNSQRQVGSTREYADVYKIRWEGLSGQISSATLKSDADPDKKKSAPAPINNSAQVNESVAVKAAYDAQRVRMEIPAGTTILQAIEKVIKQSSYLERALDKINKSEIEPSEKTATTEVIPNETPNTLRWYNVSTEIKVIAFDNKIKDYAYELIYVIQPYETPSIATSLGKTLGYYGPHKRYEYWYTGKNTEVINFELSYDNAFFNINFDGDDAETTDQAQIPQRGNQKTGQDSTGKIFPGIETQNVYMTYLFDPSAYAPAKITVLGDPDFLMRETPNGLNEPYRRFYGNDGFTINPNGGEVFVEVNFNEGVDYNNETGLMTINQSIQFWKYPNSVASKLKGISFRVMEVESTFKGGKFTQVISMTLNQMENATEVANDAGRAQANAETLGDVRTNNASTISTPGVNSGTISLGSGTTTDQPLSPNQNTPFTVTTGAGTTPTVSVPTNQTNNPSVADDDSVTDTGRTTAGQSNIVEDAIRSGA